MQQQRAIIRSFVVALIFLLADVSSSQAVPIDDPGFCPEGYTLVARYDWLGEAGSLSESELTGTYIFDSGEDIITFGPDALGDGVNAHTGSWESENPIHAFVLVSGHSELQRITYTEILLGDVFAAEFSNQTVMGKGISHIDFCTTHNVPPVIEQPVIRLFLPLVIGPNALSEGF